MLITPVREKKIHFFLPIHIFEFASTGNGHSKSFKNELVSIRYKHIVMCRHLYQIKAKLSLSIFSFPIDVTIRDWCCHLQETESHNAASKLLQQLDIVTTRCSFLSSRLLKKTFQSQKRWEGGYLVLISVRTLNMEPVARNPYPILRSLKHEWS